MKSPPENSSRHPARDTIGGRGAYCLGRASGSARSPPGGGIVKHSTLFRSFVLIVAAALGGPLGFALQASKAEPKGLDWTQFRGSKRNAHSLDSGLLKQWP